MKAIRPRPTAVLLSLVLIGTASLYAGPNANQRDANRAPIQMTIRDMSLTLGEIRFLSVELTFDSSGNLTGAEVLRGPAEYRQRALQAVLAEEYTDPAANLRIDLRLIAPSDAALNQLVFVQPEYPPLARSARISGDVRLEAVVGRDGTIRDLSVVEGHNLLLRSALAAVRQWRYEPYLLNGTPVPVVTPITVRYSIDE
jgi:TonB family protein